MDLELQEIKRKERGEEKGKPRSENQHKRLQKKSRQENEELPEINITFGGKIENLTDVNNMLIFLTAAREQIGKVGKMRDGTCNAVEMGPRHKSHVPDGVGRCGRADGGGENELIRKETK